ncbi:hypothetical protein [Salinivibrio sharmensis]|uniref:Flagellar hook-length control protein-like C-terminal domain-containing protein n=1 Tax=Salinivibrio sharmensis TaxID=390883 RepID=A0ABX3KJB4_9GAMM|nr:hypothetical protein [Salinivibrio sharmensis]OOE89744.1 hypothetical protein BZG74_04315 [Salinivibrio sharmensis]
MKIAPTNPQQLVIKPAGLASPSLPSIDGRALSQAQFTLIHTAASTGLADVLAQLHLLPALTATMRQQPASSQTLMQSLLTAWTLPTPGHQQGPSSETIAQWLTQRPADKLLATLLRQWLSPQSEGDNLTGALRLMAEQRVAESSRPGEWQWVLPFSDPQRPPVRVTARKQTGQSASPSEDKVQWQVRLYLPVGHQFVRADLSLSKEERALTLTAPTAKLKQRIHQTLDWLNERLIHQAITLDVDVNEDIDETGPASEDDVLAAGISMRV